MRATTAVSHSTRGASPDFIPCITLVRADPVVGYEYLYESVLPNRNHVVSSSASSLRAAGSPSWRAHLSNRIGRHASDEDGDGKDNKMEVNTWSAAQAFRARSPLYMQECLQSLLAASPEASGAGAVANESEARRKPWSCLAGALMSVLCYINLHTLSSSTSEASATCGAPRTVILVFSDGDHSSSSASTKPSHFGFADECAFAVATVRLAKSGVSVFSFGAAVDCEQESKLSSDSADGGVRLRALAASLAGFSAPRFAFAHVGALLDAHRDEDAPTDLSSTSNGAASSSTSASRKPPGMVVHDVDALADPQGTRKQRRRERLVDRYAIRPVMLPQPEASTAASAKVGHKRTRRREKNTQADEMSEALAKLRENAPLSHLGWLCPRCTAIMYRSDEEVFADTVAPLCPYCVEVDGV